MAQRLVFIIVDSEFEPSISGRCAIDGTYVPRSMILDPEGRHVEEISGPDPVYRYFLYPELPDELLDMLQQGLTLAR